ncbi:dihydrodipicolinate synthase family protein [Sporichthya sp.]|uniref:dihydrodipicolinate synthase family protein n=1 Tax=Sporichthya sp. TaxID=65475 RepID=UPI00184BF7CC|nr:dihydrodipicolinate synthase family protein [Sporichthya sp.]MBA3741422.1 dihydrodipicolinate synthase family protein [Sporichthya sp.]
MAGITVLTRSATTFKADSSIDEEAYRAHLQRLVDARLGVYLASGGSGEGYALADSELCRLYEIGVDACKGQVPVYANPPEGHTATETIRQAQMAVAAGVEAVCIYGPAGRHDYKPNAVEYARHLDTVLGAVDHPVALSPNPWATNGFRPSARLFAEICNRHENVEVVNLNLASLEDSYLIQLNDLLTRDGIRVYVPIRGSFHTLGLGAAGLLGNHANVIPRTFRHYIDLYEAAKYDEMNSVYADIRRFDKFTNYWGGSPLWIKMAMRVLKLPGAAGGVRAPFVLPGADQLAKFTTGLLALRNPEIDEMARAAGLEVPERG